MLFLSYVPNISSTSEQKTKITQMGVKELRNVGLFPDIIIARTT
jgi:CTP synthase (UTP-ammonia lyase)